MEENKQAEIEDAIVVTKESELEERVKTAVDDLNVAIRMINEITNQAGASLSLIRHLGDEIPEAYLTVVEEKVDNVEKVAEAIKGLF